MKVVFGVVFFSLFVFCASKDRANHGQITKIRVINRSEQHFTNVMLFSMKFQNLSARDTSAFKVLNFDPLKDDSLIYCSIGETNYARYLEIPVDGMKNVSYLIDSIQNGILYMSTYYHE